VPSGPLAGAAFLGELALDGALRHTPGILPMTIVARDGGVRRVHVPAVDAHEAGLVDGVEVVAVPTLADLVDRLRGDLPTIPTPPSTVESNGQPPEGAVDLRHVRGQGAVKRALEVAAAGGHNLIMAGPPGAGKTLAARALPDILPPLSSREALEVSKIYSVAGLLERDRPLMTGRPFRAPTTRSATSAWSAASSTRSARARSHLHVEEHPLRHASVQLCHQERGSLPAAWADDLPIAGDPDPGRPVAVSSRCSPRPTRRRAPAAGS
jgi:predicted ATPase with chaperone activity